MGLISAWFQSYKTWRENSGGFLNFIGQNTPVAQTYETIKPEVLTGSIPYRSYMQEEIK